MSTLYRAYASTRDAEQAIERLLSARVPAVRIELITGHVDEDARDAPIGTFAGTTSADAETVGSYAGVDHSGREGIGAFAGDPDRQRRGAFGDTDRDTVTDYRSGVKHTRIASHHALERILAAAGLDPADAAADVAALHAGRAVVLVESASASADVAAAIDVVEGRHPAPPTLRAAA
jgi:hypothetical protein